MDAIATPPLRPVQLVGYQPAKFALTLLQRLEDAGIGNPVLFGGAIRDHYMGNADKIGDYDVWADFGAFISSEECNDFLPETLRARLAGKLGINGDIIFEGHDHSKKTGFTAIKAIFNLDGGEISLFLNNMPEKIQMKIQGDAPLNAVAMDATGNVWAHPHFEKHAQECIYAPYSFVPDDVSKARYNHLQKKIPNLVYDNDDSICCKASQACYMPQPQ